MAPTTHTPPRASAAQRATPHHPAGCCLLPNLPAGRASLLSICNVEHKPAASHNSCGCCSLHAAAQTQASKPTHAFPFLGPDRSLLDKVCLAQLHHKTSITAPAGRGRTHVASQHCAASHTLAAAAGRAGRSTTASKCLSGAAQSDTQASCNHQQPHAVQQDNSINNSTQLPGCCSPIIYDLQLITAPAGRGHTRAASQRPAASHMPAAAA